MDLLSFIKRRFLRNVPEHLRLYCEIYTEVKGNDSGEWENNRYKVYGDLKNMKFTGERMQKAVQAIDEKVDEYIRRAAAKLSTMESDIVLFAQSGSDVSGIMSMNYRKAELGHAIAGANKDRAWMNDIARKLAEIDKEIDTVCGKMAKITASSQVSEIESELRTLKYERVKCAGKVIAAMRSMECFMCDVDGVKWYM